MAEFSLDVWRARAVELFRRADARHRQTASRRLKRDVKFIDGLAIIVEWIRKRGYSITFGRTSLGAVLDSEARSILISNNFTPEHQFYILAHECGHILIGKRGKDERFGLGYNTDDPDEKKTLQHRMDVIDEEFEAWDRGRKLARRLGVRIDKRVFHRFRAEYLRTYMQWALKVDGYGGAKG